MKAAERREKVAHDDSRGFFRINTQSPGRGDRELVVRLDLFFRPIRGLRVFTVFPTVSPWAAFRRTSGAEKKRGRKLMVKSRCLTDR